MIEPLFEPGQHGFENYGEIIKEGEGYEGGRNEAVAFSLIANLVMLEDFHEVIVFGRGAGC